MEGNIVNKFFNKIKNKVNNNNKNVYPQANEYSFSSEEINNISKQNKENIEKLRTNFIDKKPKIEDDIKEEVLEDKIEEEKVIEDNKSIDNNSNSYINLSNDKKDLIMKRWNNIDYIILEKDIDKGRDILSHNYTITYGDDALAYIYKIRDEYDILIEYLIGFNNEKKGIFNKNIFSDKVENEWRYLNNYIKVLEKIKENIPK